MIIRENLKLSRKYIAWKFYQRLWMQTNIGFTWCFQITTSFKMAVLPHWMKLSISKFYESNKFTIKSVSFRSQNFSFRLLIFSSCIIKQGLFLLGDMAILNINITILQTFLFDEFLPVFSVTDYFIEFMADFGGQSQY